MGRRADSARPDAAGVLVPIGGGESRSTTREPVILGRFVYVAGGRRAEMVVIPVASMVEGTAERYDAVFRHLGVRRVHVLHPRTRDEANDPEGVALIRKASGIFFTGGDQFRLAERLSGTAVEDAIRRAHAEGVAVAGTSAGASFLSEQMIAYGKSGSAPRRDMVTLARGLGLTRRFLIDQHFARRNRLGRLLTALATCPGAIGLGLDEDTAAFIEGDTLEVVGNASITVVDASRLELASTVHQDRHDPICMTDLALHILVHGATFDIARRTATPPRATQRETAT